MSYTSIAGPREAGYITSFNHEFMICMRATELEHVHPQTDFSHQCELCHERVGLFPSGQTRMIAKPDSRSVCNVCYERLDRRQVLPRPAFSLEDMLRERREVHANKPNKQ